MDQNCVVLGKKGEEGGKIVFQNGICYQRNDLYALVTSDWMLMLVLEMVRGSHFATMQQMSWRGRGRIATKRKK